MCHAPAWLYYFNKCILSPYTGNKPFRQRLYPMNVSRNLLIACIISICTAMTYSAPLDIKYFTGSTYLWLQMPQGIVTYSTESRAIRPLPLNEFGDNDSLADVVDNEGILWVSSNSGLFKIDMNTQTRERVPFPGDVQRNGKIAVDFDYAWLAASDTLLRYDKLGNEWFTYAISGKAASLGPILGLNSDGTNVYCATTAGMHVFSIADEKWYFFPVKGEAMPPDARYFFDYDAMIFVHGSKINRYIIDSKSWEVVDVKEPILDMFRDTKTTTIMTQAHVFLYTKASSSFRPLEITGLQDAQSMTQKDSLVYVSAAKGIIEFNITAKTMDYIKNPPGITDLHANKIIGNGSQLLVLYPEVFGIYDIQNDIWESISNKKLSGGARRLSWDDDGLKMRWSKGFESTLTGNFGIKDLGIRSQYALDSLDTIITYPDSINKPDSTVKKIFKVTGSDIDTFYNADSLYFLWALQNKKASVPFNAINYANLNLHTTLSNERYADLFFNNSISGNVPDKGLFYRGNGSDRLHSIKLGTNLFEAPQSKTLPSTRFEGGQVIVESKAKIESRDRKVVRSTTGAGLRTAQTQYALLTYSTDLYKVSKPKASEVVPGSVIIKVDGEQIDSLNYTFDYKNFSFSFRQSDIVEPSSVISVQYDIRTLPENKVTRKWDDVELLPKKNFGFMGYSFLSVSPREWIAPKIGVAILNNDSAQRADSAFSLLNIGVPIELRNANALFKLEPDFTFNTKNKSTGSSLGLKTRYKNASLVANGVLADSNFATTAALTRGYGAIKRQLDFTAGYDITKELPISYMQQHVRATRGDEDRYQLDAGMHLPRIPFADLTLSRNQVNAVYQNTVSVQDTVINVLSPEDSIVSRDTLVIDTLNESKDKIRLRIYETASTFGEKVLRLQKFSYDFTATLFSSNIFSFKPGTKIGSMYFFRSSISPITSITVTPQLLLRNSPGLQPFQTLEPQLMLQTIDAPPGFDITGLYQEKYQRFSASDSASLDLERQIDATIKPGRWTPKLAWLSPRFALLHNQKSYFETMNPNGGEVIFGGGKKIANSLTKLMGVTLYPVDRILFKNENKWITTNDSLTFNTYNDLKIWVGKNNNQWQTQFKLNNPLDVKPVGVLDSVPAEFDKEKITNVYGITQNAFTNYDHRLTNTISTKTSLNYSYNEAYTIHEYFDVNSLSIGQLTNTSTAFKFFPKIGIDITIKDFLFIQKILNNQALAIAWNQNNGVWDKHREIIYTLGLRMQFKPNILLVTNHTLGLRNGRLDTYNGKLSLMANF
jgi:hypothetical protein